METTIPAELLDLKNASTSGAQTANISVNRCPPIGTRLKLITGSNLGEIWEVNNISKAHRDSAGEPGARATLQNLQE